MELSAHAKAVLTELSADLQTRPLATERLLLRPFRETDLEDLFEYLRQPEQQRLSGNVPVETLQEAGEVLEYILDPSKPMTSFAIELKQNGKVIGNFSIGWYPFLDQCEELKHLRGVSLSYVLNQDYWRQGYMTELLRPLYERFFLEDGLDFINSGYFAFNLGSERLQYKLGMKPWMDHVFELNGAQIPTKEMLLFRADYEKRG